MFVRILVTGVAMAALASANCAAQAAIDGPPDGGGDIVVTAKKLDAARESIKPGLGATTYSLSNANIKNLPGGDSQPLNDIILQLPGVAQDGFGQFHVRDDHNGLQYRINGAIIPEGIAVFGQSLSPRLIDKLDLITGALPAQYGLRSAGIIDITTKTGLKKGATVSLYGGSFDTIQPSAELAGGGNGTSWFLSADYKHSALGLENVTASRRAIHDATDQLNGFAYLDHILSENDRISFMAGYANQHYQIPNPVSALAFGSAAASPQTLSAASLNENQLQTTGFGIVTLLHTAGALTVQGSVFLRVATLDYRPDIAGELLFNGQAQAAHKRDVAFGTQMEGVYKIGDGAHTVRAGVIIQRDKARSATLAVALPLALDNLGRPLADPDGNPMVAPGALPLTTPDASASTAMTYSAYLQDEWKMSSVMVLNIGGRYDVNDGLRNERQLSPRANLVWTPNPRLTVHGGYARYFSPPRNDQIVTPTLALYVNTTAASPGGLVNVTAFAQREHYLDIGFQQKIGRALTLGLDGYYRLFSNVLDDGQFGAPIVQTLFNYAKGRTRGVELSLNYAQNGLTAYGNLAWAIGQGKQINSGQFNFDPALLAYIAQNYIYLDHDQRWTGSAGAAYKIRSGPLSGSYLSADLLYGSGLRTAGPSPAFVPNGGKLPSYATVNASFGHKFSRLGLDVHLDANNLFDKVYEIRDGRGVGVGAPQFGARRGVFIGMTKSF
jgi:outer membrane receptor protein involved in Fe transport